MGDECRRLRGERVVDTDHHVAAASADLEVVCELVLAPRDPRAPMNPDDGRERSTGTWRVGVEASVGVGRSVLLVADGGDTGRDVTEGAQLRSLLDLRTGQGYGCPGLASAAAMPRPTAIRSSTVIIRRRELLRASQLGSSK